MISPPRLLRLVALFLLSLPTLAAAAPSPAALARDQFIRTHPCPATSMVTGRCPGWVLRYIRPICAGGTISAGNLQWLPRAEAKAKKRADRRLCKGR